MALGISSRQFCPGTSFSLSSQGSNPSSRSLRYKSRTAGLSPDEWHKKTRNRGAESGSGLLSGIVVYTI
jgi:hypothetical protein